MVVKQCTASIRVRSMDHYTVSKGDSRLDIKLEAWEWRLTQAKHWQMSDSRGEAAEDYHLWPCAKPNMDRLVALSLPSLLPLWSKYKGNV